MTTIENGLWEIHDHTSTEVEMSEFLYGLVRMAKPELVVETGCFLGFTTKQLGMACLMNSRGRVISCDVNEEYVAKAQSRCYGLPVEVRHEHSSGIPELATADLVFLDSDFHCRMAEFEQIKGGAVVAIHDTRMSFDAQYPNDYLGQFVKNHGGVDFPFGRGIGVLIKQ